MKPELHGNAPDRCYRNLVRNNNNKCISTKEKHRGRAAGSSVFLAAGFSELLHWEKYIYSLEYRRIFQNSLLCTNETLLCKEE